MEAFASCVVISTCLLTLLAFIPPRFADAHRQRFRTLVTRLAAVHCLIALFLAVGRWVSGSSVFSGSLPAEFFGTTMNEAYYYDGATSLMLALVSFVGFVVSRYSVRYLDGEERQGRYFKWLGFTIGVVSLMVISGSLTLFVLAWFLTGIGIHRLLMHYRDRPAARRAAWTKFLTSRLGDTFLVAAIILSIQTFGTVNFSELLPQLTAVDQSTSAQIAIGWLLVIGAIIKSAQFPFHNWLPETMEAPTPVSALMHAGIVNAGGFLIIRTSPLVSLSPSAMTTLALVGALTACLAAVSAMTQASIKRGLAFSTIAQMGFMMLQCGIGAYSAAMLHIIAHSLYKAHAFLSSGSVVSRVQSTLDARSSIWFQRIGLRAFGFAAFAVIVSYALAVGMLGVDLAAKPGGWLLSLILCTALVTAAYRVFAQGNAQASIGGLLVLTGLSSVYLLSYIVIDSIVAPTISAISVSWWVAAVIALAFTGLLAFHALIMAGKTKWLAPLYVHAVNGFYVAAIYRRLIGTPSRGSLIS